MIVENSISTREISSNYAYLGEIKANKIRSKGSGWGFDLDATGRAGPYHNAHIFGATIYGTTIRSSHFELENRYHKVVKPVRFSTHYISSCYGRGGNYNKSVCQYKSSVSSTTYVDFDTGAYGQNRRSSTTLGDLYEFYFSIGFHARTSGSSAAHHQMDYVIYDSYYGANNTGRWLQCGSLYVQAQVSSNTTAFSDIIFVASDRYVRGKLYVRLIWRSDTDHNISVGAMRNRMMHKNYVN
jgi:hypothetical protein